MDTQFLALSRAYGFGSVIPERTVRIRRLILLRNTQRAAADTPVDPDSHTDADQPDPRYFDSANNHLQ